jgi:hypothetical protein
MCACTAGGKMPVRILKRALSGSEESSRFRIFGNRDASAALMRFTAAVKRFVFANLPGNEGTGTVR